MIGGVLFAISGAMPAQPVIVRSQVFLASLLVDLLNIYSLLIIARAVASWINPSPTNQIVRFLQAVTDPIIIPIRNVVPPIGGTLDISPLIALVLIQIVKGIVVRVFW